MDERFEKIQIMGSEEMLDDGVTLNSESESNISGHLAAQVLDQIDAGVLVANPAGEVCYVNNIIQDWLGPDRLHLGESIEKVLSPASRKGTLLMDALRDKVSYETKLPNGLYGFPHPMRVRIQPLPESTEDHLSLITIRKSHDLSAASQRSKHRSSLERILVDLSQFFVANEKFNVERLLDRVGDAIDADHVYLITAPPDDAEDPQHEQLLRRAHDLIEGRESTQGWPVRMDAYEYRDWWRTPEIEQQQSQDDQEQPVAHAVPILSARDKLYGYLGLEFIDSVPDWFEDNEPMLDVLGDMLSAYLERQFAERALRASEERYRLFVKAISEGIWCLEPDGPVDTTSSEDEQFKQLRDRLIITECNQTMADLLEAESPEDLLGQRLDDVLGSHFDTRFLKDFITGGYVLHSQEYEFVKDEAEHHFVANAVGTHEGNRLTSIWGSWTDVTDRVALERRMVSALEMQQQRIGHELHDGVGQLITGVSMLSQNLAERHFDKDSPGYEKAMKIVRFTRESQQLLKELQRGLAPVQVQGRTLAASLEGLARNVDDLPGVRCSFHHDEKVDTNEDELKLQLYRIAQEAINNALKHGEPNHITMDFGVRGEHIVMEISDDGRGFDPESVDGESLGLVSIHYRAKSLNAEVSIDSAPGEGTTVVCRLAPGRFDGV